MLNKTIAKFFVFVILITALSLLSAACSAVNPGGSRASEPAAYSASETTGKIKSSDVKESSGIAASKCQSDVFWSHNDSGDEAFIFAFNSVGDSLGTWLIPNVENRDWEDIATWKDSAGRCFIYIGEIGDNKLLWPEHAVIRVPEPLAARSEAPTTRSNAAQTLPANTVSYVYPDGDHDAEALMVHPQSADIFVVTKTESGPAHVYRLKGDFGSSQVERAIKVAELSLPSVPNGMVTGGDIAPDGRRVVICDYRQAYELELPELAMDFDEIWKQKAHAFEIGRRKTGEAICYSVDGTQIFATSEGKNPPITSVRRVK